MPRLIDADSLEKSLTEKGDDYKVSMFATADDCNIARLVAFECAEEVKNAPTIEAEPVVHCKDCKFFRPYEGEEHKGDCAELIGLESCVYEEDFCSYGAKMDLEG